jgi:mono/diheme cytochrome c family protein
MRVSNTHMEHIMKRLLLSSLAMAVVTSAGYVSAAAPGADVFEEVCSACHGDKGQGIPGLAPPLKGSEFVKSSDVAALTAFVQKGRAGAEKKFPNYPSAMPPYTGGQAKAQAVSQYVKTEIQK